MNNRLESLDWLRGLMALSIMLYHFGGGGQLLWKLGIYAVSIFFILSGLSMAIAYDGYIKDVRSSGMFFIRRLFRIWPLLWIAITCVVLSAYFSGKFYSNTSLFLNFTTLFGFLASTQYINMGAWSIGNEMVYYALTPAFITAYHWHKSIGNLIMVIAVAISIYFSFFLLNPSLTLASQWALYINPLNNLFFYCAGLAIYYNFKDIDVPRTWHYPLLLLFIACFFIYPTTGDQVNITTGFNRLAISLISILIVLGFYKCPPLLPNCIGGKFEQLGIATYGIYLLHPIVRDFTIATYHFTGIQIKYLPTFSAVVLTIALALFTFKFIESPMIKLGKRITQSGKQMQVC